MNIRTSHVRPNGFPARRRRPSAAALALAAALACAPASAGAQNLLLNGSFHSDVLNWDESLGTLLWTNLTDEGDCSGSGAALVASEPSNGQHYAALSQCVPLDGQVELHLQVRHMGYGTFSARLDFYTAFNCAAGSLAFSATQVVQTPTVWQTTTLTSPVPAGTHGVAVTFTAIDADPHGLVVDEATLADRRPLFLDGFDGNQGGESDPCRWAP